MNLVSKSSILKSCSTLCAQYILHGAGSFPSISKHNLEQGGAALDGLEQAARMLHALSQPICFIKNIYHSLEAMHAGLVVSDEQSNRAFK